jgi:hypothetical protein
MVIRLIYTHVELHDRTMAIGALPGPPTGNLNRRRGKQKIQWRKDPFFPVQNDAPNKQPKGGTSQPFGLTCFRRRKNLPDVNITSVSEMYKSIKCSFS